MSFWACVAQPSDGSGPGGGGGEAAVELRVEATAQPTVFRLGWEVEAEAAWVDVIDEEGGTRRYSAQGSAGAFEALLVLPASSRFSLRAGWEGGEADGGSVQTGDPPAGWPSFELSADDGSAEGYVLGGLTSEETGLYGVYAVDRLGRYVWWAEGDDAHIADAHLSADGGSVEWLAWDPGGVLARRSLDGAEHQDLVVPGIHHRFEAFGEGWVTLGTDAREYLEDVTVQGDELVFIGPDGSTERPWSTWDEMIPEAERLQGVIDEVGTPLVYDWTHGNGTARDEASNKWWISLRNLDAVAQVDGDGWTLDWLLGGPHGEFELLAGEPFSYQHSPRRLADGHLLIFDNGMEDRARSRVAEYAIDETARSYTEVWAYEAEPSIYGSYTGSADRLDDGGTFICWGAAGILGEVDAEGGLRWELRQSDLSGLGFAEVVPALGSPSDRPGR